MLKIKRIYDPAAPDDGQRIYIDRLWPRGMKKEEAKTDEWVKEISPSDALRKWFSHDPAKYAEFKEVGQLILKLEYHYFRRRERDAACGKDQRHPDQDRKPERRFGFLFYCFFIVFFHL